MCYKFPTPIDASVPWAWDLDLATSTTGCAAWSITVKKNCAVGLLPIRHCHGCVNSWLDTSPADNDNYCLPASVSVELVLRQIG